MTVSHLEATCAAVPSDASVALIWKWALLEVAGRDGNATALLQASPAPPMSVAGG